MWSAACRQRTEVVSQGMRKNRALNKLLGFLIGIVIGSYRSGSWGKVLKEVSDGENIWIPTYRCEIFFSFKLQCNYLP